MATPEVNRAFPAELSIAFNLPGDMHMPIQHPAEHRNGSRVGVMGRPSGVLPAWRSILGLEASPHAVGLGLATGVFVAFLPILGVQMVMAAMIAWVGRANVGAALLGTWAGNPITWPVMWVASYLLGIALLGDAGMMTVEELQRTVARLLDASPSRVGWFAVMDGAFAILWPIMKPLFAGSLILGAIAGGVLYVVGRRAAEAFNIRRQQQA